MDPILERSASDLARAIRAGELSSAEVVERHIEHIQRVNPRLNALVADRFEQARLEAKRADELARSERDTAPEPFLGVPCSIKESICVQGMPNSCGVLARAGRIAERDATVVARLRAAGAIPLGVTNCSEITAWPGADNKVYGRTGNAYDPERSCGGSSGGEGAIVGTGGAPFGIGTDIGGSIRIPAFCNGVFGHKPTGGLVPATGQYPAYTGAALRINTTGPLARRAEDLMPLLRVLAGPDGEDAGCLEIELGDPAAVDLARLRVFVVEGDGRLGIAPEQRGALHAAAYALARRGARAELRVLPRLRDSLAIWSGMMMEAGGADFSRALGDGEEVPVGRELLRYAIGASPHTHQALLSALVQRLGTLSPKRAARGAARGRSLRAELDDLLGDDGVLLYPTARNVAPRSRCSLREISRFSTCFIFNVMELPSTQVPMGLGSEGLPLGVQVVAGHGRDHVSIAAAIALEQDIGGWVPPRD